MMMDVVVVVVGVRHVRGREGICHVRDAMLFLCYPYSYALPRAMFVIPFPLSWLARQSVVGFIFVPDYSLCRRFHFLRPFIPRDMSG